MERRLRRDLAYFSVLSPPLIFFLSTHLHLEHAAKRPFPSISFIVARPQVGLVAHMIYLRARLLARPYVISSQIYHKLYDLH